MRHIKSRTVDALLHVDDPNEPSQKDKSGASSVRFLKEYDGIFNEVHRDPITPTQGRGSTGAKPARRTPVDFWRGAASSAAVPSAHLRACAEAEYSGERCGHGGGNRDFPEARRIEGWRFRQCCTWAAGSPPSHRGAVLVLRSGLQS